MMCQGAEDMEVSTEEFDMVRSNIFNFHSMQLIIIVKLKRKKLVKELSYVNIK